MGGTAMKGSMDGVIPMLGLLIISVVLATQSLPIATALASVLEESATDLSSSAKTTSTADHVNNHYLPDSAEQSVDKAAYRLGQDNAGVSWNQPLDDASEIYNNIESVWEDEANSMFSDYISNFSECDVENSFDLDIYPYQDSSELFEDSFTEANFSLSSSEPNKLISVKCRESSNITYREEDYEHNLSIVNRYANLGNYTAEFYRTVEDEFNSASISNSYSGDGSACGSRSTANSRAESNARNEYTDDTPSVSSIANSISKATGLSVDVSQNDDYAVTGNSPGSGSCCRRTCTSRNEDGECTSRTCVANTKTDTVTISPTKSEIGMELTDTMFEVGLDKRYRSLEMIVDEYIYAH